ncbi:hypothetical protein [Paenibacillus sp. 7516]|nr:hypothetical protein [Paenibacillus sp. 7516]
MATLYQPQRTKEEQPMAPKRKPPALQQKKEEVNRKAIAWTAASVIGLIIIIGALIIIANM